MKGSIFAFLSIAIWSGSFLIARLVVGNISPLSLTAARWLVSLLVLLLFALPTVKREWSVAQTFLPQIIIAGIISVTLYAPLVYFAAQTTSAINLSLIAVITPVFIVIICAFMGKKQSTNTWIGSIVALIGSLYLVANGNLSRLLGLKFAVGDLLMLVDAIIFAFYSIILSKVPKGLSQTTILFLMTLVGLICLIPIVGWEIMQPNFIFKINGIVIFSILFTGIACSLMAWWLWNLAIVYAGPSHAGMIYYGMPILSSIVAFLFIGEPITPVHIISALLIIGGIAWSAKK
ncbi:DMT family transporter [Desulfotalea psychrophila]|nr:DMT family transporter [Desulfotalea psychrophila]